MTVGRSDACIEKRHQATGRRPMYIPYACVAAAWTKVSETEYRDCVSCVIIVIYISSRLTTCGALPGLF